MHVQAVALSIFLIGLKDVLGYSGLGGGYLRLQLRMSSTVNGKKVMSTGSHATSGGQANTEMFDRTSTASTVNRSPGSPSSAVSSPTSSSSAGLTEGKSGMPARKGKGKGFMGTLASLSDAGSSTSLAKDVAALKVKVAALEMALASGGTGLSSGRGRASTGLKTSNFAITAKTVDMCGVVSFTIIGVFVGASLLDRLWLLGGVAGGYWASTVNKSESKAGKLVRKTGAQLALIVRDVVDMYNQFVVFYQTGKLGYKMSQTWDTYDRRFSITDKVNAWKRSVVERSTKLGGSQTMDQLKDFWNAVATAPRSARKFNREYGITANVGLFFKGVGRTVGGVVGDLVDEGRERADIRRRRGRTRTTRRSNSGSFWEGWGSGGRATGRRPMDYGTAGTRPWAGPFPKSDRRKRSSRHSW